MCGMRFQRGHLLARLFHSVAVVALGAVCFASAANADPFEKSKQFPAIDEFRFGILATNLEGGGSNEGDYAINGELLFGRFRPNYADPVRQFLLNPRPHIGFSINPSGGTSQAYTGLTWDFKLTSKLFVEGSFGGAIHDGPTGDNNSDSYGCSLLFRESASVGIDLTDKLRVMATVDHISNAGLCPENQGLTNAGVRLGYRW